MLYLLPPFSKQNVFMPPIKAALFAQVFSYRSSRYLSTTARPVIGEALSNALDEFGLNKLGDFMA